MIYLIVGCELVFWGIVLAGFVVRYGCKKRKLSSWILSLVFFVDILLLFFTIWDSKQGNQATFSSTLAPFYLGFSLMWGHRIITWCDRYVLYKLGQGKAPKCYLPVEQKQRLRYEWQNFLLDSGSILLTGILLLLCIYVGGGSHRSTLPFIESFQTLGFIAVLLLGIDLSYIVFPSDLAKKKW